MTLTIWWQTKGCKLYTCMNGLMYWFGQKRELTHSRSKQVFFFFPGDKNDRGIQTNLLQNNTVTRSRYFQCIYIHALCKPKEPFELKVSMYTRTLLHIMTIRSLLNWHGSSAVFLVMLKSGGCYLTLCSNPLPYPLFCGHFSIPTLPKTTMLNKNSFLPVSAHLV